MPPTRRSARNRSSSSKEIVAPGFGTNSDVRRLSQDLGGTLPVSAVTAMMRSEGRGIRGKKDAAAAAATENPLTSPKTSNAWADFIQEEGVSSALDFGTASTPTATATTSSSTKKQAPKPQAQAAEEPLTKRRKTKTDKASSGKEDHQHGDDITDNSNVQVEYDLSILTEKETNVEFGSLVQSGTLDSTLVGRKPIKSGEAGVFHLHVPAVLLPKIAITKVCTSCNAAHAIAIDKSNQAYGWGRNEGLVLGSSFGENVTAVPTPQLITDNIETAALGKAHTIFMKTDGSLHALGTNKVGQCAWRANVKQSGTLKACLVDGASKGTVFCKISCGEDFSVALDTEGVLYTTGSSEYGQLGNGETGEYFLAANKLAYTNGYEFAPQTLFYQTDPNDTLSRNDVTKKTVPIRQHGQIRFQDIACGKHHAIALEAPNTNNVATRIFSWGCGDYGCLGHGRQHDEYFPRHVQMFPRGMSAKKLAAGAHCSLVLTAQGHVYYWGQHKQNSDAAMKPQLVDALANNQHVVTQIGAGNANVACSTDLGNTVVWGSGPYGELGLGNKKSSAKPAFVESLSGISVLDMACGQGSILYVVKDDTSLPRVDLEAVEEALKK